MDRDQLDCIAPAHLIQNLNRQMQSLGRDFDRWLFDGIHCQQIERRGWMQARSQNLLGLLASLKSSSEGMKETRLAVTEMAVELNCDDIVIAKNEQM